MNKLYGKKLGLAATVMLAGTLGFGSVSLAQTGRAIKPFQMAAGYTMMNYRALRQVKIVRNHLRCKAWGSPAEFPRTALLTNDGSSVIPAGTRVHYYITRGGKPFGNYTFSKPLKQGASVYASLSSDTAGGAPCTVNFLAPVKHYTVMKQTFAHYKKGVVLRPTAYRLPLHAICRTGGEGEYVDYAELTNDRGFTIPAGTRIHYAVNKTVQGDYTFSKPLASKQHVWFKLSRYTANGLSCSVTFK